MYNVNVRDAGNNEILETESAESLHDMLDLVIGMSTSNSSDLWDGRVNIEVEELVASQIYITGN